MIRNRERIVGAGIVLEVAEAERFTVYTVWSWRNDRRPIVNFLITEDGQRDELDFEVDEVA